MTSVKRESGGPFSSDRERFALNRGQPTIDRSQPSGLRPFALRFVEERCLGDPAEWGQGLRYCPERQIAVSIEDPGGPVITMSRWERTTIGGKDGNSPSQEDWKMDDKG